MNWKMFDGFDPKGVFYTDSNGLEMQKRQIVYLRANQSSESNSVQHEKPNLYTISGNFYPVDTAIAMRDRSGRSNLQVTIMNDRPQAGSADLTEKAEIELMQHRRILQDDALGLEQNLNETDDKGDPIRVTALYHMQIFDTLKASSLQRTQ